MPCTVRISLVLFVALLLQACASAPRVMQFFPDDMAPDEVVVWPPPPEVARFEYAGLLIGESNFTTADGARDGMGVRFFRWVAGLSGRQAEIRQLIRPQSGTVDANGRILVTDAGRQAILVFDEVQGELSIWEDAGDGGTFQSPVGIASHANGDILVADAALGAVIVLTPDGSPLGRIGEGVLQRPSGLSVDPASGEIFVSDTVAHDIKVFGPGGKLLRTIGRPGTSPGEFNGPTHIQFNDGRLYVTDTLNARVQVMTAHGDVTAEIGRRGLYVGNLVRPKGVTNDMHGNVYVIESYYDHLLVFDADGNLLMPIGGTGNQVGQFFLPAGIWSDSENRIFVADMFNGRVVVLRYLGG